MGASSLPLWTRVPLTKRQLAARSSGNVKVWYLRREKSKGLTIKYINCMKNMLRENTAVLADGKIIFMSLLYSRKKISEPLLNCYIV